MPRALISVANKQGLDTLAAALIAADYDIIASSGTAKALKQHGIACLAVDDITGFPEILDGRVKTLHPHIHAALLARRDQDQATLAAHQITPIDLVVVNLYPFAETLRQHPKDHTLLVENIDIGGPALLRAAAKNHQWVSAVIDPDDYPAVITSLPQGPDTALRQRLAAKTFAYTSAYDACIADYLATYTNQPNPGLHLHAVHEHSLRYGENPHQQAKLYHFDTQSGWGGVKQYQGKELSFNNIADSDAAWNCISEFTEPSCVIVKHANPCGVASSTSVEDAYAQAFATDTESAFGGVIAVNAPCELGLAQRITSSQFAEVIIAPSFSADALQHFTQKPNLRIISLPAARKRGLLKSVSGGFLWQANDDSCFTPESLQLAHTEPNAQLPIKQLRFAWQVVKHVKSNAIVVTSNQHTIGIGAGQTSRVRALQQALEHAQRNGFATNGSVLASDAFFPFADSIEHAARYGVRWIIQPGGSKRDAEVIEAARRHGITMVLTGTRHFYH